MRGMARLGAATIAPAVLLQVVAACTSAYRPGGGHGAGRVSASSVLRRVLSGAAASGAVSLVSSAGSTCSVTLAGTGSRADVLGTTIAFGSVDGNRANLRVGDRPLRCTVGEEVAAGPLRLTCTAVADGSVTLTVRRAGRG